MEGGVKKFADALIRKGYDVEIFDGETIPKEALFQFKELTKNNRILSNDEIMSTELFKANVSWAEMLKKQGYTVIDIGNPMGRTGVSIFYDVETKVLF